MSGLWFRGGAGATGGSGGGGVHTAHQPFSQEYNHRNATSADSNVGGNGNMNINSGSSSSNGHGSAKGSIKDAVKALYPPKNRFSDSFLFDLDNGSRSRFSSLLLEHGEQHIQDWAVIAYTTPGKANPFLAASSPRGLGRSDSGAANGSSGSGSSGNGAHGGNANKTQWVAQTSASSSSRKRNKKKGLAGTAFRASHQKQRNKDDQPVNKDTHPTVHMTKIEGRLHLCSRSVVFEPTDDLSRPILRCPFVQMEAPPKEFPSTNLASVGANKTGSYEPMCVEFLAFKHLCCKTNNKIGPTSSVAVPTQFRFTFLHSKPSTLVDLCNKLFNILHLESTHKSVNKASSKAEKEMQALLRPMYERPFDPTNFLDVRERPLLSSNLRCHVVQPLQKHPGCLVVTHERIYFQPAHGVLSDATTSSATHHASRAMYWDQGDVIATARRYHGLQDNGLEVFWKTGGAKGRASGTNSIAGGSRSASYSQQRSTLFELRNKHEREQFLRLLPNNVPCHTDREFVVQATKEWQNKSITNYEYLLLLNSASSRTTHDLSRYPVFPWIITDYTSEKLDINDPKVFRDLTKPMGALNPERLEYFQQRYQSMVETNLHSAGQEGVGLTPFLYGTHYSAAGYVLYYLMRNMPEHMLCLQNGKFDAPDRMFHNVENCYNCVLTNHADVKELIPEFFTPNYDSFLMNIKSLQLGATQMGDRVDDVILPNWARSPRDFIRQHNRALESEICTNMLPRWIDLIFGNKSRGDAAREANNVFHSSAYMGPADWSNMASDEERFQAELQATEFGIVPDQLFVGPHPLQHETVDDSFIHRDLGRTMSGMNGEDSKGDAWELLDIPSHESGLGISAAHHNGAGTVVDIVHSSSDLEDTNRLDSVEGAQAGAPDNRHSNSNEKGDAFSGNGTKGRNDQNGRKSLQLSGTGDVNQPVGTGAFSDMNIQNSMSNTSSAGAGGASGGMQGSLGLTKVNSTVTASVAVSSNWDIKIIERIRLHDEAISGCHLHQDNVGSTRSTLTTTSLDGGLKVHHVTTGATESQEQKSKGFTSTLSRFSYLSMSKTEKSNSLQTKLTEFRSHTSRDPLACLALTSDGQGGQVAFAGGHDDVVLAYGINSACAVASVYSHRDAVTGLDLILRNPTNPPSVLWRQDSTHIMISGSWDATVKVWSVTVSTGETVSINREPLAELFDADSSIVSVSAHALADKSIVIAAGCADGSFCVWNLHCDGVKVVIHKETAKRGSGPCSVVRWTQIQNRVQLFTGFSTGKVATHELMDGAMRRIAAVSVGVAIQCLTYSEGILLIGCADGGLRLIQVRGDGSFSTNPTLWKAVNNSKTSPGITSITLAYIGNFIEGSAKCICCTGAEDGSVAMFELKNGAKQ